MTAGTETALSSGTELKDLLRASLGDLSSGANTIVDGFVQKQVHVSVTDGGTAGTAQTETAFWRNYTGGNVRVIGCYVQTPVTVTAAASNNATFTLAQRDSAGANSATIAAGTTSSGGTGTITAFAPCSLTLTAANVIVPSGGVLTIAVAKNASGVAIAAATSQAVVTTVFEPA